MRRHSNSEWFVEEWEFRLKFPAASLNKTLFELIAHLLGRWLWRLPFNSFVNPMKCLKIRTVQDVGVLPWTIYEFLERLYRSLKTNSFSLSPKRSKANPAWRNLNCILCSALTPIRNVLSSGLILVLYLFWDRKTGRGPHSPGNDPLRNLDDLHTGMPPSDTNDSRHWHRDVLPSCDHRSDTYSLQEKMQRKEAMSLSVGFSLFACSHGTESQETLLVILQPSPSY